MNCPVCGNEMWDNREGKRNPKAPDFKCKDKDCEGVIWPPRGAKSAPRSSVAPRATGAPAPEPGQDRSSRIERQHSQEMALRWFSLIAYSNEGVAEVPPTEKLRAMIDWFQRDVGRVPAAPTPKTKPMVEPEPEPEEPIEPEIIEANSDEPF